MAEIAPSASSQQRQRGRPFVKGRSGNPAGRPRGSKNRMTLAARELLEGEAAALTRKAVEMALGGDAGAMRLCLERVLAPRREPEVRFDLPPIRGAGDVTRAMASVMAEVAQGGIAPGEANELGQLLDTYMRALEATDFECRLKALETGAESRANPYRADFNR